VQTKDAAALKKAQDDINENKKRMDEGIERIRKAAGR
jgi:hypothetical protein